MVGAGDGLGDWPVWWGNPWRARWEGGVAFPLGVQRRDPFQSTFSPGSHQSHTGRRDHPEMLPSFFRTDCPLGRGIGR